MFTAQRSVAKIVHNLPVIDPLKLDDLDERIQKSDRPVTDFIDSLYDVYFNLKNNELKRKVKAKYNQLVSAYHKQTGLQQYSSL